MYQSRLSRHFILAASVASLLIVDASMSRAQSAPGLLATRGELTTAAAQRESAALSGPTVSRAENASAAASIRQRLSEGDFQIGDRVVVNIISDAAHRDTAVVRSNRSIELLGMIVVPLSGVLRSEVQERVSSEVLKYVKAQAVETTPLLRVGILGAVTKPGYFALASDVPVSEAIMSAGGPTAAADLAKSVVRRRNQEYRSPGETSKAIASGMTLDQFGLSAGDELVIGQRSERPASILLGLTGALATVLTLFVALHR
jgi:protein involved in polysaccharide export with SLBB domain